MSNIDLKLKTVWVSSIINDFKEDEVSGACSPNGGKDKYI
jgi:hypothetical protein